MGIKDITDWFEGTTKGTGLGLIGIAGLGTTSARIYQQDSRKNPPITSDIKSHAEARGYFYTIIGGAGLVIASLPDIYHNLNGQNQDTMTEFFIGWVLIQGADYAYEYFRKKPQNHQNNQAHSRLQQVSIVSHSDSHRVSETPYHAGIEARFEHTTRK